MAAFKTNVARIAPHEPKLPPLQSVQRIVPLRTSEPSVVSPRKHHTRIVAPPTIDRELVPPDKMKDHEILPPHSSAEVEALQASLMASGIITPVIVDEATR